MNGSPAGVFVWDAEFPLVTNPLVVGAWARAMGATWLTSLVVLTGIAAAADGLDRLPWMAGIFTLVVGGVFLLGLAILWLVFGNRYRARFQVSERGVAYQALDRRGRVLARFAVVAGLLAASPGAAGAGLVSISRERIQIPWSAVTEARCLPRRHAIRLRRGRRDLLHLYCTPANYDAVCARVARALA